MLSVVTTLFLVLASNLSAMAKTSRAPVPDTAQQAPIAKLLTETYALDKLDTTSKKQQTARQLLEASRDASLPADERYVLLITLIKLTQEIADFSSWREAVERLVATYDIDAGKETTQRLKAYLESTSSAAAWNEKTAESIGAVIEQVARYNQYDDAAMLLTTADAAALRMQAPAAIQQTLAKSKEAIAERQKAWEKFQSAAAKLAANADDPAANLIAGRWQAAYEENWPTAASLLMKSKDPKWMAAAAWEQQATQAPAQQAVAGDAWWDLAVSETGSAKTALMLHAGSWYEQAQRRMKSGFQKQLIAKRLAEIALLKPAPETPAEIAATPQTAPKVPGTAPQKSSGWVNLLEWSEGVDWAPRCENWNQNIEGTATREGITLKPTYCNRFPLPAIIKGDYEMEIEFTRFLGREGVYLVFPVGIHNLLLDLRDANSPASNVSWIDGKSLSAWSGVPGRPGLVTNSVRHRVRICVTQTGDQAAFHIDFDQHKDYFHWSGPSSSLTSHDSEPFRLSMVQHPWLGSNDGLVRFHKAQLRMLSGTLQRDVITPADREADLKAGYVRLLEQPATELKVGWSSFLMSQLPFAVQVGDTERLWPLVTREPRFCTDYYGAHAPSRFQCPIPVAARSFSTIGYNQASQTTKYQVLIDGKKVYDSGVTGIAVIKADIPSQAKLLELVVDPVDSDRFDYAYWCYPRFHTVPRDQITDQQLDSKSNPLKFVVTSHEVGKGGRFTHNQPMNALLPSTIPLSFRDAVPCHEFLFCVADSSATFQVPAGMARFTAVGYNVVSNHVKFEVWADGKFLYGSPQAGIIPIQVKLPAATKTLTLKTSNMGDPTSDFSMWCYPRLHRN
ncbi:MAG: hypothetical protein JWN70_7028 [Planctomycetaceae bacterium]|nr:hypothetical protein [Planctomycetaceae bacterium]